MLKLYFAAVVCFFTTTLFGQIPTANLKVWYDAANVVADGSGNVNSWPDQSSNGFSAVPVLPGATLETITGHDGNDYPFVHFSGNSYLSAATLALSGEGITIFTVFNNAVNPSHAINLRNTTDSLIYPFDSYRANTGVQLSSDPFPGNRSLGHGVTGKDFEVSAFRYERNKNKSGMSTWRNGVMLAARSSLDVAVPGLALYIGGYQNAAQSDFATTDIGEIIIYYGALDDVDMETVNNYLLNKYNINLNQYAFSAKSGDWSDPTIWAGNLLPGPNDDVIISPESSSDYVNIDGLTASCKNLIILEHSGVRISSFNGPGLINVGVGNGNNSELVQKGSLLVDSGNLVIHGNWLMAYNQNDTLSDGLQLIDSSSIVIDGNNGIPSQSVDATKALIDFQVLNPGFGNFSSRLNGAITGKADITIVDPHLASDGITMRNFQSNYYSGFSYPGSAKFGIFRLGDGISSQASNNPRGFVLSNCQIPWKVIVNSNAANNRRVSDLSSMYYTGGMKIIPGAVFNSESDAANFEYDLDNDGTFNKPVGWLSFFTNPDETDSLSIKGTGVFNTSLTGIFFTSVQDLNIKKIGLYVPFTVNAGYFIGPGIRVYLNNQPFTVNGWDASSETSDWFIANPSYFICNGTGRLVNKALILNDSLHFFMGFGNVFTPVTIVNKGVPDQFSVAVKPGITSGANPPNLVNFEWLISEGVPGNSNSDLMFQWRKTNELFAPDTPSIRVKHFNTSTTNWETLTTATAHQSLYPGYRRVVATGVSTFSPFSIAASNLVLPVNLLSFTGQQVQDAILLNWQTAQEQNSDRFEIERSPGGNAFTDIGRVAAAGNTTITTPYSFTDKRPLPGVNYYRLKQIDLDGKFVYSKTVPVNFSNAGNVSVSPNPISDQLRIQLPQGNQFATVRIIDASGKQVFQKAIPLFSTNLQIDIAQLASGWYLLQLAGKEQQQTTFLKK